MTYFTKPPNLQDLPRQNCIFYKKRHVKKVNFTKKLVQKWVARGKFTPAPLNHYPTLQLCRQLLCKKYVIVTHIPNDFWI